MLTSTTYEFEEMPRKKYIRVAKLARDFPCNKNIALVLSYSI